MQIDTDAIRALADLLEEKGLGEIEVREGDATLRVAARAPAPAAPAYTPPIAPAPGSGLLPPAPFEAGGPAAPPPGAVLSPMVGTVYLQPEPGAEPFVKVGQAVAEGDTVAIVEAMKVMNPIRAESGGTVASVAVTDGQPVEFGDILVVIR